MAVFVKGRTIEHEVLVRRPEGGQDRGFLPLRLRRLSAVGTTCFVYCPSAYCTVVHCPVVCLLHFKKSQIVKYCLNFVAAIVSSILSEFSMYMD